MVAVLMALIFLAGWVVLILGIYWYIQSRTMSLRERIARNMWH